jgi:excisionase family DNA binding protein
MKNIHSLPEYFTPREAARLLKVSLNTIYRQIKNGSIPVRRVGTRSRISSRFLMAEWLDDKPSIVSNPGIAVDKSEEVIW